MLVSIIFNSIGTGFYLLKVKIKLMWHFHRMTKNKKQMENHLRIKLEKEGLETKIIDKIISKYTKLGSLLMDRKLMQKALMSQNVLLKSSKQN